MAIRDILVTVDASAAGEGRLRLALALARSRKARLTALYVLPEPRSEAPPIGRGPVPPSTAAWMPATSSESEPPRDPERAEETERLFRRELRSSRLEGEWCLLDERDMRELVEYANASDLTILGQESSEAPGDGLSPDAIIVEVGRPVLIVPYAGKFEMVGRRALIAWDGSREAARALGDALPLIEGANVVTVIYVGAGERELERAQPRLDRIVRHLQRHAVKATAEETPRGEIAISDLLLSRAADLGADLIVAGAYHHSRLREALLGGVSRGLLQHTTVPVLMSH